MKLIKRLISAVMCAVILFLSPVSVYFGSNNILTVHASGPVALTAEAIYVLCQYLGSLGMAYAPVQRPDLPTDEEVLEFGYKCLKKACAMTYPAPFNAVAVMYDSAGIPYVYGSEALQEAAETEFTVIQGAGNPDDDNNNDDDDESKKTGNHLLECWRAGELLVAGSAVLGDCITNVIYDEYSNYINGEPSLYDDVFADLEEQAFTGYDSLTDIDGKYFGDAYSTTVQKSIITNSHYYIRNSLNPCFVRFQPGTQYDTNWFCVYNASSKTAMALSITIEYTSSDGSSGSYSTRAANIWHSSGVTDSFSTNMPIFSSDKEAIAAFETGDFTAALNYAKTYKEADWLAEDWAGKLIDPLTGLNALSNFSNIARHQGLNALGNELTPDDYVDYLRDYFANLGTDTLPEVDPAVAPIVFSGEMPAITIDPARNPVIQPVTDPGTNPGTDPGSNPDPGTGIDPGTDPTPDTSIEDTITQTKPFFGGLSGELKNKFPFSIPWDLIAVFTLFQAEPETPRIEVPFVIESLGIEESIVIDLSDYGLLSRISRSLMVVLFVLGLIKMTPTMLSFGKDL